MESKNILGEQLRQCGEIRDQLMKEIKAANRGSYGHTTGENLLHLTNAFLVVCERESKLVGAGAKLSATPKADVA